MKLIKHSLVWVLLAVSMISANAQGISDFNEAAFFKAKYKKDKVWDVQRFPAFPVAGQDWTLSGLKDAFDAKGGRIDWGNDRYLMLVAEADNSNGVNSLTDDVLNTGKKYNVSLQLFESNGTLVKVISKWGKIAGIGEKGFMYEEEGHYGTFFSVAAVPSSTTIKYKPTLAVISKLSEIVSSSPLTVSLEKANDISESSFFSNKYTKENVWDVQRSPAYPVPGQVWTLSGLKGSLESTGIDVNWGVGRYVMLIAEVDNTNNPNSLIDDINANGTRLNISMKLYESNGTLVKVISKWGKLYGIGAEGFMYEVEGRYGTFFSVAKVTASDIIKYKPNLADITKLSQLTKGLNSVNDQSTPNNNIVVSNTKLTTGTYVIENLHFANQVLQGSKDGSVKLGNVVGSQKQIWQITDVGDGMYRLEFTGVPTKCLDASAGTKGKVQLWDILGSSNKYGTGGKNQLWKIVPDNNGTFKIYNVWYSSMVLEAAVKTTGKVQLRDDLGNAATEVTNANNQRWRITKK